jgi:hypothetical protein
VVNKSSHQSNPRRQSLIRVTILKWILIENVGGCGPNSSGSVYVSEAGSRDYGNIISGSINDSEICWLAERQLTS